MIQIGPFTLSVESHELTREGARIPLRRQAFELLAYLAQNPGRLVSKDELLDRLWPNRIVEEAAVKVVVGELRKALGDRARDPLYIQTIHRCGYRLIAPVASLPQAGAPAAGGGEPVAARSPPRLDQQVCFCSTGDGVRLAYASTGEGPALVKAANWLNHLDLDWQTPIIRHWLTELSRDHRLVRYDQRGSGLSDREVESLDFDSWVRDLEAVADAALPAGEPFSLLGISQGGAVAIAYAVRHPERVRRLVLFGAYARGWGRSAGQPEVTERRQALLTLARLGWGKENPVSRQVWTSQFMPAATWEESQSFNELQRASTSAGTAARFIEECWRVEVEGLLPQVRVPTLVLHSRHDTAVPYDEGRRVAAGIPGARFVGLDSPNHLLLSHEPAWPVFVDEVRRFLAAS